MLRRPWISDTRKITVCVDTYENGVPKGRFYNAIQDAERFDSLSQFLLKTEAFLDDIQEPQSYTTTRKFRTVHPRDDGNCLPAKVRKGAVATFEVQVLFRQHTSWQGIVIWKEEAKQQSFRSVLELILLMDSALRTPEENRE